MTGVARFYGLILRGPWWILLCYALVIGVAVSQLPKLRLDASSDSLLLQGTLPTSGTTPRPCGSRLRLKVRRRRLLRLKLRLRGSACMHALISRGISRTTLRWTPASSRLVLSTAKITHPSRTEAWV